MGCGQTSHRHKDRSCPALNKTCSYCRRLHHFSSVCRKKHEKKPVKCIKVNAVHITPPEIQVQATLVDEHNSVPVAALVDTGSATFTIDDQTLQRFNSPCVRPTDTSTRNFDGSTITHTNNVLVTNVTCAGKCVPAELYVVPEPCPTVFGRDLLKSLNITVNCSTAAINALTQPPSNSTTAMASDNCRIGIFPDYEHHISLTTDARPRVAKLRPIALSKRDEVLTEIRRMLSDGIWSHIDKSEWQHVLVIVDKPNGGVRITSDLSALSDDIIPSRFPLPHFSDLTLQLRGARFFSKLDLEKAYYQYCFR